MQKSCFAVRTDFGSVRQNLSRGGGGGDRFPDRFAKRTHAQYTRYMAAPAMPFGMYARWATIKLHGKKDAKLYPKKWRKWVRGFCPDFCLSDRHSHGQTQRVRDRVRVIRVFTRARSRARANVPVP